MCGDTQIEASHLRVAMKKMKESLPGESSYHQQFSVSLGTRLGVDRRVHFITRVQHSLLYNNGNNVYAPH